MTVRDLSLLIVMVCLFVVPALIGLIVVVSKCWAELRKPFQDRDPLDVDEPPH